MKRETEKISVSRTKYEFTVKSWLTGGEVIDLEATTAGAGTRSVDGRTGNVNMDAEQAYRKRLRKLIGIMVESIVIPAEHEGDKVTEGRTVTNGEEIWGLVCELPQVDYNTLMLRLNGILEAAGSLAEPEKKA
jgi:hypothetical protein